MMRSIGLIGGMSWESTSTYYTLINRGIREALGKNHSARCLLHSFDFQEIEELQYDGKWDALRVKIIKAGQSLKLAGADFIILCTNTMHKVTDGFENEVGLPFLHIADAVGREIAGKGLRKIGLLGTIFTMEQDFYKKRLEDKFGLEVLVPEQEERVLVNAIIYGELVKGVIAPSSREKYERIIDRLRDRGAEGIILGCTEIGLLVKQHTCPLFDSTLLHARQAVEMSLRT